MLEKIKAWLAASSENRVVIRTAYRNRVYAPVHADLFISEDAHGVYVRQGKRKEYVFSYLIHLAHVEGKTKWQSILYG